MKIKMQGDLLAVTDYAPNAKRTAQMPSVLRGVVRIFSVSSRRRLLRIAGALDASAPALFVTLTMPQGTTHNQLRQAYNAFRESMRRAYPGAAWLWRKELHRSGTPHMHLILYNIPFLPAKWLWNVWERSSGGRHRVDIQKLDKPRAALRYVAKYLAKVEKNERSTSLVDVPYLHADEQDKIGRWWGIHNRDKLPFAECVEIETNDFDLVGYLSWYVYRILFKRAGTYQGNFTALSNGAVGMMTYCAQIAGKPPSTANAPLIC